MHDNKMTYDTKCLYNVKVTGNCRLCKDSAIQSKLDKTDYKSAKAKLIINIY